MKPSACSALASWSVRFPDFSVAGFLTSSSIPLPHAWTNGVFVPTVMEVLEPRVGSGQSPERNGLGVRSGRRARLQRDSCFVDGMC